MLKLKGVVSVLCITYRSVAAGEAAACICSSITCIVKLARICVVPIAVSQVTSRHTNRGRHPRVENKTTQSKMMLSTCRHILCTALQAKP